MKYTLGQHVLYTTVLTMWAACIAMVYMGIWGDRRWIMSAVATFLLSICIAILADATDK